MGLCRPNVGWAAKCTRMKNIRQDSLHSLGCLSSNTRTDLLMDSKIGSASIITNLYSNKTTAQLTIFKLKELLACGILPYKNQTNKNVFSKFKRHNVHLSKV